MADDERAVYRVKTVFPGANGRTHDYVRAVNRRSAKWWAEDRYERGVVERVRPSTPDERATVFDAGSGNSR